MGIMEELRWTTAELMRVGKFTIDSTVNEFLKGSAQVYAIVKGKLKGQGSSDLSNGAKKHSFVLVEELQARIEKMQEDMNNTQPQCNIAILRDDNQKELKEFSDEPLSSSIPEVPAQKKIFIRSRL